MFGAYIGQGILSNNTDGPRKEQARFNNFSGLPCARLSRSQSVRGEERENFSKAFRIVSSLFLGVPLKYLKLLDGIYIDNIVFQAPFAVFVGRMSSGWQQDVVNVSLWLSFRIRRAKRKHAA